MVMYGFLYNRLVLKIDRVKDRFKVRIFRKYVNILETWSLVGDVKSEPAGQPLKGSDSVEIYIIALE